MKKLLSLSPRTLILLCIVLLSVVSRMAMITKVPPSPYWEEAALGYDAYSVLQTGRDHHGNLLPIVAFESFGDYKPAGYFYAIIPFIVILGVSVLAVRLPSALAGVIIIFFVGKIAKEIFPVQAHNHTRWYSELMQVDILAMIATLCSPWAIQLSRGGWEVNLATSFVVLGVYSGLLGIKEVHSKVVRRHHLFRYYLLCVLFFVLSAYTYHSTRVIAPILGIVMTIPMILQLKKFWKEVVMLGVFSIILMSPLLIDARNAQVTHRLQETSAFTTQNEINESNTLIQQFGSTRLSKIIFHRYWFFGKTFVINFVDHFRLGFLFLRGDNNIRHSTHYFGLLYPTDSVLLAFGVVTLLYNWRKRYHLLWIWLLIGIVPAAITKDGPHALRTLPVMPVYMMMIGFGTMSLLQQVKTIKLSKIIVAFAVCIFVVQVGMFWHFYLNVYPKDASKEWQYGYEQMVHSVQKNTLPNEKIYITTEYKRPAMYYWFFTQTDPRLVQAENSTAKKDQSEFLNFAQIDFTPYLTGSEKGLIASTPAQREHFSNATDLEIVNDLQGQPLWVIYRIQ